MKPFYLVQFSIFSLFFSGAIAAKKIKLDIKGLDIQKVSKNSAKIIHKKSAQHVEIRFSKRNRIEIKNYKENALIRKTLIFKDYNLREWRTRSGKWQRVELRYDGDYVNQYKNGKLIHRAPKSFFGHSVDAHTCQRFKSTDDFVKKIAGGNIEDILTDLHFSQREEFVEFSSSCREKNLDDKLRSDLNDTFNKGIRCLMNNGDKSIQDAMGLVGVFFLENRFQIKCAKSNEEFSITSGGEEECKKMSSGTGGVMPSGHDNFPMMIINSDSIRNFNKSIPFHELMHALGYTHGNTFPDIVYMSQLCCFPEENSISDQMKNSACSLLRDRPEQSVASLKAFTNSMPTMYGHWSGQIAQKEYMQFIAKNRTTQSPMKDYSFEAIRRLSELLENKKDLSKTDKLAIYLTLYTHKYNFSFYNIGSKKLVKKVEKQLEVGDFDLEEKNLIESVASVYRAWIYGADFEMSTFEDMNNSINILCEKGSESIESLLMTVGFMINFDNSSVQEKWRAITGRKIECKKRPRSLDSLARELSEQKKNKNSCTYY